MKAITNGAVELSQNVKPPSALPHKCDKIVSCCMKRDVFGPPANAPWRAAVTFFASEILHCRAQYDLVNIHVGGLGHGVGDGIGDGLG